jgi:hypothetical protein
VAPGTGGISVRGGRSWAIWRAVQAVQVGFRENEGEEMGTIVPHGLHTIADPIVADRWHTTVAALVAGIFLNGKGPFTGTLNLSTA